MKIKIIFIRLAAVVSVLAGGLPLTAIADKTVEVDMRCAGTFMADILHADIITGTPVPSGLGHSQCKGSLGRAELRGFGNQVEDGVFKLNCLGSSGAFWRFTFPETPTIFTFKNDLSLLYVNGTGEVCIDQAGGPTKIVGDIIFMGGRGRFEGATGVAENEAEAEAVSTDGSFSGETSTIVGWISLPDDDDDHHGHW